MSVLQNFESTKCEEIRVMTKSKTFKVNHSK